MEINPKNAVQYAAKSYLNFHTHSQPYKLIPMRTLAAIICLIFVMYIRSGFAQTLFLQANGSQDAYTLINDKLVEFDGNAFETPDCSHQDFGPHITQIYDEILRKHVFRFHIHRDQDTDRCVKFDRQRTEIKVYAKSPDWMKATEESSFTYKWKFKVEQKFQPSKKFTHFFQLKSVGGAYGMPLLTLTARKGLRGKPDRLELRHATHGKASKIRVAKLQPFLGTWLQVTVEAIFGTKGKFVIQIISMNDNNPLLYYENNSLNMWKEDTDFIRPKWGIYRSLRDKQSLRDEVIDFADIEINVN
ncbi:fibronectin type III [Alphaproteobacteria bacterium]|nr:fibronectin type III [Alphaproteobacteria bacterium]